LAKNVFLFCPTTKEGKISASEYFGSAKNLLMMQDRYADAMVQFELTADIHGIVYTRLCKLKRSKRVIQVTLRE